MSDRTAEILRLLSGHDQYITIDTIAEATGAGVRTIHRDLERLERTLALRGVRLDRRRGQGIRLVDPLPDSLRPSDPSSPAIPAEQRPFLILLQLLANGRWTKLSELAHTFFVSDSSVSSDLSLVEPLLPEKVRLERQKGVGVRVTGEEQSVRMLFLMLFPRILPRYLLLQPGNGDGDDAAKRGPRSLTGRLLEGIGFHHASHRLMQGIAAAEEACGYKFAPSFFCLFYCYLFIIRRRVPETGPIRRVHRFPLEVPHLFRIAADRSVAIALGDVTGGDVPPAEINLLALILSTAEPASVPDGGIEAITSRLSREIDSVLEHTLGELEERERVWLHDDPVLLDYLRVTIAAALRRIALGLPRWREFASRSQPDSVRSPDEIRNSVLTQRFLHEFREVLETVRTDDIEPFQFIVARELGEAELALEARLETLRRRRAGDIVIKILCYEGLGMSTYLSALARDVLPPGARIDATWESPYGGHDFPDRYDLVICTFPLDQDLVPVLVVDGDAPPDSIRRDMRRAILSAVRHGVRATEADVPRISAATRITGTESEGISLPTIMNVIHSFFLRTIPGPDALLTSAVDALDSPGDCNRGQILADFERREGYGSLVFEEVGIQLLHCRTKGIPEPRAGVVRYTETGDGGGDGRADGGHNGDPSTVLVMAAPASSPPAQTRVLSELVVALTEVPGFPELLSRGDRSAIQAGLLTLFSRPQAPA